MAVFTWMISLIMGFWSRYFDNRWCVQTWIQSLVWSNIYLWIWTVESAEIFDCLSTSDFEIYTMTVGCQQQRNWIVLYNVVKSWTRNLLIRKVLTIRLATNFFCIKRLFITKCNNILVSHRVEIPNSSPPFYWIHAKQRPPKSAPSKV